MKCRDRFGNDVYVNEEQGKLLSLLYDTTPGKALLSILVKPCVSKLAGIFLDSKTSTLLIKPFISHAGIDMSEYIPTSFKSYNDFFTRKIKPECRVLDTRTEQRISPCDSKLSVYPINDNSVFTIKGTDYTLSSLVKNDKLARHYKGGTLLMFRLCVDDYHRYCFVDDGIKTKNHHIKGVFHTVNPIANDHYPIYKENTREFCILKSMNFGNILTMEVGALLVGRIVNYCGKRNVQRGEEKGRFEFGGSTIILCFEKDSVVIDNDILENSANGIETIVKLGERIGATCAE